MVVGFENTCTFLSKWNVSRVVTWLYKWISKILKTTPIISSTALSRVPISVCNCEFPTRGPSSNPMSSQFPITHTLSFTFPPYFQEQLRSYWAPFYKYPERWLFASSFKHIVHILLYIFLIVFYPRCIYVITTSPHKEIFSSEIHKSSPVFNSHLLTVLATCNTSLGQPPVWIS